MPTVVIVAGACFPPVSGPGIHRVLGWANHLPQLGWKVIVLALPLEFWPSDERDATLLNTIRPETEVIRPAPILLRQLPMRGTADRNAQHQDSSWKQALRESIVNFLRQVKRYFLLPDTLVLWVPAAVRVLDKLVSQQHIDVVISTSPENSSHLVGWQAAARHDIPWIADFRDPWQSVWHRSKTPLHAVIQGWMARQVLQRATHVTAVSPNLRHHLAMQYGVTTEKISVVTNGFDPASVRCPANGKSRAAPYTIVHTGLFYGRRTPKAFLAAVADLVATRPEFAAQLEVRFVGDCDPTVKLHIAPYQGASWLKLLPSVLHSEAVRYQRDADALLLIPGQDSFTLPSKVFEYLVTGRPILALCSANSDTAHLLAELGTGMIAPADDALAIRQALVTLLKQNGELISPPEHFWQRLAQYSRPVVVGQMADILSRVCVRTNP